MRLLLSSLATPGGSTDTAGGPGLRHSGASPGVQTTLGGPSNVGQSIESWGWYGMGSSKQKHYSWHLTILSIPRTYFHNLKKSVLKVSLRDLFLSFSPDLKTSCFTFFWAKFFVVFGIKCFIVNRLGKH